MTILDGVGRRLENVSTIDPKLLELDRTYGSDQDYDSGPPIERSKGYYGQFLE